MSHKEKPYLIHFVMVERIQIDKIYNTVNLLFKKWVTFEININL